MGARAPIRRTEFCAVSNFAPRRRQVAAWISWFSGVLHEKKSWKRNGARELEVSHWSTPRFDNTAQLSKRHRSVASSPHSIPVSENRQITTNECRFWRRKNPIGVPLAWSIRGKPRALGSRGVGHVRWGGDKFNLIPPRQPSSWERPPWAKNSSWSGSASLWRTWLNERRVRAAPSAY